MTTLALFDWSPPDTFAGEAFDEELDGPRLGKQLAAVRALMLDGKFRTLAEISEAVGSPEASVSARLRDLRGVRGGRLLVERRRRGEPRHGHFEYRVTRREEL